MSDVIEVADAEQITGHINSILIQTPDRSTFVKGTCQEESKWWYNVLVQLVKSKVRHHKRNAFLKGQNQKCKFDSRLLSRFWLLIDQCLGRRRRARALTSRGLVWELSDITGCLRRSFTTQLNGILRRKSQSERASGAFGALFEIVKSFTLLLSTRERHRRDRR